MTRRLKNLITCVQLTVAAYAVSSAAQADITERAVSELTLRPAAYVSGDSILLQDVLSFANADERLAAEIGPRPALLSAPRGGSVTVTHDQVVQRLEELGVNLSRVLVGGAAACRVTVATAAQPAAGQPVGGAALAADAEPIIRPRNDGDASSLSQLLTAFIQKDLAELGGTPQVEFERASREFLVLTSPPYEFSIRDASDEKLGLREFSITIRRDGRVQRTVRLAANVKLLRPALIARRPLNIGTFIRAEDVTHESRLFERWQEPPFERAEQVVGQQAKRYVPAGELLHAGDIKSVDLVQRSRPVTVTGGSGNLALRLTGVALDSGGYGQTVRVRLGDSRKDRREVRGVVTGVATVQLTEDGT
jgi:flagella basal body P-ring formation protein FlgA